jgi:hypothetical protein
MNLILILNLLTLLEFYLLPAVLDQKSAGNTFPADFGSS